MGSQVLALRHVSGPRPILPGPATGTSRSTTAIGPFIRRASEIRGPMEALHARYPFLAAARRAVEEADVDLAAVVARDTDPIVERAVDRVRSTIESGTVGAGHPRARVELLSYPVARVLVSLVDDPALIARYASAEAETAYERFRADREAGDDLRSVDRERLTLTDLLHEFDLESDVRLVEDEPDRIAVGPYLRLSGDLEDDRWRLVTRELADGFVRITREELDLLLREAVRERVADGLPLSVPDRIATDMAEAVSAIRERLETVDLARDFDAVEPALFPPCVDALLERAMGEEPLPSHSRYALVSFLAAIGMETDAIVEHAAGAGLSEDMVRRQVDHVRGGAGPTAYAPPSCVTMDAYGDCVNQDALCDRIAHPLEYYEERLDGAEPERLEPEAD